MCQLRCVLWHISVRVQSWAGSCRDKGEAGSSQLSPHWQRGRRAPTKCRDEIQEVSGFKHKFWRQWFFFKLKISVIFIKTKQNNFFSSHLGWLPAPRVQGMVEASLHLSPWCKGNEWNDFWFLTQGTKPVVMKTEGLSWCDTGTGSNWKQLKIKLVKNKPKIAVLGGYLFFTGFYRNEQEVLRYL